MSPTPGEAIQVADPLVPQDSTHLSFTEPVTSCSAPDGVLSATDCPKMQRAKNAPAHCRSKVPPPSGGWWRSSTTAPSGLFRELSCNRHCVLLNIVAPVVGAGEKKKDFFFSCASAATLAVTVFTCAQGSFLLFLTPLVFLPQRIRTRLREGFAPLCLYSACYACVFPLTSRLAPVCVSTINKQC